MRNNEPKLKARYKRLIALADKARLANDKFRNELSKESCKPSWEEFCLVNNIPCEMYPNPGDWMC